MIETGTVVLPRDAGGQFDELLVAKIPLELIERLLSNVDRRQRHLYRVAQHKPFKLTDDWVSFKVVEGFELLFGDSQPSADRRPDVDSERAADEHRHLHLSQCLELRADRVGCLLAQLHMGQGPQQARMMGDDFDRGHDAADFPLGHEVREADQESAVSRRDPSDSGHTRHSLNEKKNQRRV